MPTRNPAIETASPHVRVACYVRKSSLAAPVDSTIRTLDRLETDGAIDEFTVDAWPAEVRLGDDPPHSDAVDVFEEFDAWAEQWNVSVRPPFTVEARSSEITGESCEVLVTPVQCLAIYLNGVLKEVFPHATNRAGDGETYTVADALTLLEEHDIRAFGADQSPATPPDQRNVSRPSLAPDACPACEARLVTGQGVYACPDCDWVGTATGTGQYRPISRAMRERTPDEDPRTPDLRR